MNATNDVIEQRSTRPLLLNQACRILVPSDFSASSHAALEYATFLAWRTGASIDLLHVLGVHPAMGRERRRVLAVEYNARMAELDELAGAHRKAGVQIRCRLEFGSVAATISRVATSSRADLVVMGSSGGSTSSRSTAATVSRAVRCPVIHMRALAQPGQRAYRPIDRTSQGRAPRHDVHDLA